MCSFISCIKVYAYAYEHSPKRKMVPAAYFQMLQAVIVQDTVIDPFACSALTVDCYILLRTSGDTWLETQVTAVLYVDSTPIAAGRAFFSMGTGSNATTSEGAAVFMRVFDRVISPWAHFMSSPAERMAVFVESNVIRRIFRSLGATININQRIDIPAFQ